MKSCAGNAYQVLESDDLSVRVDHLFGFVVAVAEVDHLADVLGGRGGEGAPDGRQDFAEPGRHRLGHVLYQHCEGCK